MIQPFCGHPKSLSEYLSKKNHLGASVVLFFWVGDKMPSPWSDVMFPAPQRPLSFPSDLRGPEKAPDVKGDWKSEFYFQICQWLPCDLGQAFGFFNKMPNITHSALSHAFKGGFKDSCALQSVAVGSWAQGWGQGEESPTCTQKGLELSWVTQWRIQADPEPRHLEPCNGKNGIIPICIPPWGLSTFKLK